jgi:hypothetical protein
MYGSAAKEKAALGGHCSCISSSPGWPELAKKISGKKGRKESAKVVRLATRTVGISGSPMSNRQCCCRCANNRRTGEEILISGASYSGANI